MDLKIKGSSGFALLLDRLADATKLLELRLSGACCQSSKSEVSYLEDL